MADNIRPRIAAQEINSHISEFYVRNWDLRHLFRELIANQLDEIVKKARALGGSEEMVNCTIPKYGDFDFSVYTEQGEVSLGCIRWSNRILTLENFGAIPRWAKLIGGSSNFELTAAEMEEVRGRFGEAWLASLRLEKPIVIRTGGEIWTAALKNDPRYQSNGTTRADPEAELYAGKVVIQIHNVDLAEWIGTPENNNGAHSFLMLIEALSVEHLPASNPLQVPAVQKSRGAVLLAKAYAKSLWVNGVFVARRLNSVGMSLRALPLNRDRDVVFDVNALRNATSHLLGDILEHHQRLQNRFGNLALLENWDQFIATVYAALMRNSEDTWHLHTYPGSAAADVIFDHWRASHCPVPDGSLAPMPVCSSSAYVVRAQIVEKKVSPSIYPLWAQCSWQLNANVCRSTRFRTLDQRIAELTAIPNVDQATFGPAARAANEAVQRLLSMVRYHADTPRQFKDVGYNINFSLGNAFYLSSRLLSAEQVQHHEAGIEPSEACAAKMADEIFRMTGTNTAVMLSRLMARINLEPRDAHSTSS